MSQILAILLNPRTFSFGMNYTNHEIAMMFNKSFKDDLCVGSDKKDIVLVRDIPIFSYCEHHIALMYDMSVSAASHMISAMSEPIRS